MHVHVYTLYDSVYTMYMHGSYHISPQTFLRLIWQALVHVQVHTRYDSVYAMYVHGDRWQEGCCSAGEEPARSWDSQESQGWLGLMESEVCLWSWTDVSVLCTYKHIHPCARMYLVHTTTYIHEHVCTWYIQVCTFMNMYIHVHECSEIHKHVHTVFRHVCTVLPYPGRWVGFQIIDSSQCERDLRNLAGAQFPKTAGFLYYRVINIINLKLYNVLYSYIMIYGFK